MAVGYRTAAALIALSVLGAASCSLLPFRKKPSPGPRDAAPSQVAHDDVELAAFGTSSLGPEAACAVAEYALHDLVVDTLSRESGLARTRLRTGQYVDTDRVVRSIASLTISRSTPTLRSQFGTARVESPVERGDNLWSCQLRLKLAAAHHKRLLDELKLRFRDRLDHFSSLLDSTGFLVSSAPFGAAVDGLRDLYARGCSEWLLSDRDMAAVVGPGLDALQRRVRIQFTGTRPEGCFYSVSVRTVDPQGRSMPAVPLKMTVRPETGRVVEPNLPSNILGDAVFSIQPLVSDSVKVTVELSRSVLAESVSPSLASGSLARSTLQGRSAPVRASTVLDLRGDAAIQWDVRLIPDWVSRRSMFGRSLELGAIRAAVVINSTATFPRRAVIRCTGVTIGSASWTPKSPGMLLATFRLAQGGSQMRPLATSQLLEQVTKLTRKQKGGAQSPVRIRFAIDLDAACFVDDLHLEQSRELRHHTHEGR